MPRRHHASSALPLLLLLAEALFLHLATPNPLRTSRDVGEPNAEAPPPPGWAGNRESRSAERQSIQRKRVEEEEEEELFKDVDPKQLAAVLLEALNEPQVESRREDEDGLREESEVDEGAHREVGTAEGSDRKGRQELERLMVAHGKEQEQQEEEERRKAQEEEERMTEKVTSRTTSQTVQKQPEQQQSAPDGGGGEPGQTAAPQPGAASQQEEEEEQLSPEELKSLETMMKEFPRLNTATKREGEAEPGQRESRGYSSFNEILPPHKSSDLHKEKLKWQEETQKALHFPSFMGGNFMDEFQEGPANIGATTLLPAAQQEVRGEEQIPEEPQEEPGDEEEEEEEEEVLSPEEEEVRAKAEQEEMRRQAAEAQRAKMEEEKLADIASDMLLRYMVKQNNGNRKYGSSLANAMEDKRSDEEQEATEEDDIDPQTIDKLIEISSKLHLPADDVVDIISDVEKKKKKDVAPDMSSRWQRPQTSRPSPLSSATHMSTNQNDFPVSKQASPAVNLLKSWFQEKPPTDPERPWSKPTKTLSNSQDRWSKPQKPVWTGYPFYPYNHPSYYQRKPYPYYPVYYSPPPRPRPRYYLPNAAFAGSRLLGGSVGDAYPFPPRRRYQSWVQPRLRRPPTGLQQSSLYAPPPLQLYPGTYQPLSFPRARPVPRRPLFPPQNKQLFYSAPPSGPRNPDYYELDTQRDGGSHDDLEKYIQQILLQRPQRMD